MPHEDFLYYQHSNVEHLPISACLADATINDLAFSLVIAQL